MRMLITEFSHRKIGDMKLIGIFFNRFGSGFRSKRTGIILNNQMDDLATPGIENEYGVQPSPANFIEPGKRPFSSMCPVIVLDENKDAIFIFGSAGGTRITTSVSYVSFQPVPLH